MTHITKSPLTPLISIIIPAYNAAHFLPTAIQSCLEQTYTNLEIIVVNDGSTDDTHHVASAYEQVICIDQPNKGLAGARNTGIDQAKGEFLQFLDADDLLLPTKIQRCVEVFMSDPHAGLVYTDYQVRTEDMSEIAKDAPKPNVSMVEGNVLLDLIQTTTTIFRVPCPLVRRKDVIAVGKFSGGMQGVEDWNLWIKLAAHGLQFRYVNEELVWYRHSVGSMSKDMRLMTRSRLNAMLQLRELDLPPQVDLERLIAGRYHQMAMVLWEADEPKAARTEFRNAIHTHSAGIFIRRLLIVLTYLVSYQKANQILGI